MKKIFTLILISTLTLFSCVNLDDDSPQENPGYAMTAKLNGVTFEANNPYGNYEFSSSNIWNYFPIEYYVMLQGRQGGLLGNPEINIWLKRSDIVVGTYEIGQEAFVTPPSHFIDLIDNASALSNYTKAGVITITEVNNATKIVKGTFQFTTTDDPNIPSAPIVSTITDGTFRYTYE